MTKEAFIQLLDRYIEGRCTEKEREYFDRFFQAFQQEEKYWATWNFSEKERVKIEIYQSLMQAMDEDIEEAAPRKRSFLAPALRIAASVIILCGIGWVVYVKNFNNPKIIYLTRSAARGQKATVTLSDGSVVKLNAESSISFPEKFETDKREITLTGEAFFEVKRDPEKPFIIKTGALNTVVLGTSFNIRAYWEEKEIKVTVKTGTVQVKNALPPGPEITLTPNQQVRYRYTTGEFEKREASLDRDLAWTDNIIYLDNTSMREMISTLEKWYDVKITLENEALGNCLLSGKYKGDRFVNILEGLKFMQGIEYRFVNDREVLLRGKPCN